MKRLLLVSLSALLPGLVLAQNESSDVHHENFVFGIGSGNPVGNATSYLSNAPLIRFGYGYRFNRLFQADAGIEMAFGAANDQNAVLTEAGPVQGGDHEFMIPLGGRVYLPLPFTRISVSAGGGAAYLHYSETASSSGGYYGYSSACYSCTTRGGWGGYGMGNISYFLNSSHNLRVGTTVQYIAGSTNGQAVANIPATRTTDHWLNVMFDFGVSF